VVKKASAKPPSQNKKTVKKQNLTFKKPTKNAIAKNAKKITKNRIASNKLAEKTKKDSGNVSEKSKPQPVKNIAENIAEKKSSLSKAALSKKPEAAKKITVDDIGGALKVLLSLGKSQGFLTFDQIGEHIDSDAVDSKKLEKILDVFSEFKIQVVEKEDDIEKLLEDEASSKDEEKSLKRSEDSVKTYLKSMSNVKLLTRENEVEIAIRIEEGRAKTVRALYRSPMVMRYFIDWYEGLANGTILLRDIIRIDETYNSELEEMIKNSDQQQASSEEEIDEIADDYNAIDEVGEAESFEDEELEAFDESVVSFVSMERILMPKMLDLFQNLSKICQKILDKSSKKTVAQLKVDKNIIQLKKQFEALASEVSFNDNLIKALVSQLYDTHKKLLDTEISLLKLSYSYDIDKSSFLDNYIGIEDGEDWIKKIAKLKDKKWLEFYSQESERIAELQNRILQIAKVMGLIIFYECRKVD
jgi:RNA polymerase primary sigma factor